MSFRVKTLLISGVAIMIVVGLIMLARTPSAQMPAIQPAA